MGKLEGDGGEQGKMENGKGGRNRTTGRDG